MSYPAPLTECLAPSNNDCLDEHIAQCRAGLGTEHPQQNRKEMANSDFGGAESGARRHLPPKIAPELAGLIGA